MGTTHITIDEYRAIRRNQVKQAVLCGSRRFEIRSEKAPIPGSGEALIRIGLVGICGSDMHLYRDGRIGEICMDSAFVIGHECMGTVEDVGPGEDSSWVGKRVAIEPALHCGLCEYCCAGHANLCPRVAFLGLPPTSGAMTELMTYPLHLLEPLSDTITDEGAVVLEPLAVALHAIRLVKVQPGQTIVILGTGVLGTCVLSLLSLYRGVETLCVDILPDRLARAEKLGASRTLLARAGDRKRIAGEIMELTRGRRAQVVFECAGSEETLWNMAEVAAAGGHVAVIGTNPEDRIGFASGSARRKGLTFRFVRRSLNTLKPCISLAEKGLISPGELVTHTFKASQVGEAFEMVDRYEDGILKAVIDMTKWS